jgi:photosystem II oxygen-evolving enhancer protein 2
MTSNFRTSSSSTGTGHYFGLTLLAICTLTSQAWSPLSSSSSSKPSSVTDGLPQPQQPALLSRRQAFQVSTTTAAAAGMWLLFPQPPAFAATDSDQDSSIAEETPRVITRQGGLLEAFQDGPRSIRIMAPSGWNKFEGEVGAYDIKWQDLVDPSENIKISSTPVKSTTESIAALGTDVQVLGENLAAKRKAKLVSAKKRLTDGILFYEFEFALSDKTHQLLGLCVCKGKLWSLDASSKESRWSKRSELYHNVLGSFMPKLS